MRPQSALSLSRPSAAGRRGRGRIRCGRLAAARGRAPGTVPGGLLSLAASLWLLASPPSAAAEPAQSPAELQHLPIGTRCRGFMPCERSGDFGVHARLLAALSLDEQYRVRQGLLVPSLVVSLMNAAEVGLALPLRFHELSLPVPERLRLFGQLSLPKSLLPGAGAAVFANINLALGPLDEAAAPSGARASSVDVGGALGGDLGAWVHAGAAAWATLGTAQPVLHAGLALSLRTDYFSLFAQAQGFSPLGCFPTEPACAAGLLATFGLSGPWEAAPASAHVSIGRGAAPTRLLAVQGGLTYDVRVRARHGDGIAAAERGWDQLIAPLRYRLLLRRRGYYDPHPDQNGLLRDDHDGSVLGILGVPHPSRPGYILTPSGISIPIGASLEVLGDRPLIASPAFPGRVIPYLPLSGLTAAGRASAHPVFDETYFSWLEQERLREEQAAQDDLRRMDTPWAKAALNALAKAVAAGPSLFLAAASPDTPDFATLVRQSRPAPYRDGYEEFKGELAEALLLDAALLLTDLATGPGRRLAATTARELAAALSGLRAAATAPRASRAPRLLAQLAPRLNPSHYTIEIRGLGSNFGNVRVGYSGAEAAEVAGETTAEYAQIALRAPSATSTSALPQESKNLWLASAREARQGGVTPVGRALQKHAARPGSAFTGATGNANSNTALGEQYLKEILDNPDSVVSYHEHPVFGKVVKIRQPDGLGAWFKETGEFIGFLERYTVKP